MYYVLAAIIEINRRRNLTSTWVVKILIHEDLAFELTSKDRISTDQDERG